jgi:hypothetical protein
VFSISRLRSLVVVLTIIVGFSAVPVQVAGAVSTNAPSTATAASHKVSPSLSTCLSLTQTYVEHYSLNTIKNLCVVNAQGYSCSFSVEYGNIFTIAYARDIFNSGYCTISYPYHGVIVYYKHTSTYKTAFTAGPYNIGTSWTLADGPSGSDVFAAHWIVCIDKIIGHSTAIGCTTIESTPF